MSSSPSRRWAVVSYILVGIFWGTSAPAIRYTTAHIAPLWTVVIRFALAGTLLFCGLSLFGSRPTTKNLRRVLPSAVALAVSNILVTFGFQRVESGAGALLLASSAVHFAVIDLLWPGSTSKPRLGIWLGLLVGLAGVAVLVLGNNNAAQTNTHWSGYIMLAGSSFTWSLGGVAQARHPSGKDPLQDSAWQMLLAAALALPFTLLSREPFPFAVDPKGWGALAYLVVTASLIAFVGFVHMIRHLPAYIAGTYTYVNAIVAALSGCLVLGEHLDLRFYIASALVFIGVALTQVRERPKPATLDSDA